MIVPSVTELPRRAINCVVIRVTMIPGATALTKMSGEYFFASERTSPCNPALAQLYAVASGEPRPAAIDAA